MNGTTLSIDRLTQAHELVLKDLVNALLQENLLGIAERGKVLDRLPDAPEALNAELCAEERWFVLELKERDRLAFRVRPHRFLQPYKLSGLPVLRLEGAGGEVRELDSTSLILTLAESVGDEERAMMLPSLGEFVCELEEAVEQTALSLEAGERFVRQENEQGTVWNVRTSLLRKEQLSALRDRPFHPTSRAKRGFSQDDYRAYTSEYGRPFSVCWAAVHRSFVKQGASAAASIAELLLTEAEAEQVQEAMVRAGLVPDDYLAFPVHPWQMEHALSDVYAAEMAAHVVHPLDVRTGRYVATSSLRALVQEEGGLQHLKLPISIYALAALRIMPLRYLSNAERAQELLKQVVAADPLLAGRMLLCDESQWWGFHDPNGDSYADKPGHLSCLIRRYPQQMLTDENCEWVPMSALAVVDNQGEAPVIEELLRARGNSGKKEALALFAEIAHFFIETTLRLFRRGLMPEVHGQNVVLSFRKGCVEGMLLRDHDTLRLHLPWLKREGFDDPEYEVKPGTPNSLINETPDALLSYFQTLGLQVNVYAIADAVCRVYGVEEADCWKAVRKAVKACLHDEQLPDDVRSFLKQALLESATWPTRTLIGPMLRRVGSGGGSMPAGVGTAPNPLREARGLL